LVRTTLIVCIVSTVVLRLNLIFLIADDILEFYKTPVDKTAPLDAMKSMKLPENLHIQTEYHRFHPGNISTSVVYDRS
jgi:hypothetical protein